MIEPCLPTCSHHGSYDTSLGHCRLVDLSELEKHLSEMKMFQYQYFNLRDAFVAALYLRLLLSSGRHSNKMYYFRCREGWRGESCNVSVCSLECGDHGSCLDGGCQCDPGWEGVLCDIRQCSDRCLEHGQCSNGTCVCQPGWNGKHCTLDGCAGDCHGHGECRRGGDPDEWRCECQDGWGGAKCDQRQETECQDEIDNDKGETFDTTKLYSFLKLFPVIVPCLLLMG